MSDQESIDDLEEIYDEALQEALWQQIPARSQAGTEEANNNFVDDPLVHQPATTNSFANEATRYEPRYDRRTDFQSTSAFNTWDPRDQYDFQNPPARITHSDSTISWDIAPRDRYKKTTGPSSNNTTGSISNTAASNSANIENSDLNGNTTSSNTVPYTFTSPRLRSDPPVATPNHRPTRASGQARSNAPSDPALFPLSPEIRRAIYLRAKCVVNDLRKAAQKAAEGTANRTSANQSSQSTPESSRPARGGARGRGSRGASRGSLGSRGGAGGGVGGGSRDSSRGVAPGGTGGSG